MRDPGAFTEGFWATIIDMYYIRILIISGIHYLGFLSISMFQFWLYMSKKIILKEADIWERFEHDRYFCIRSISMYGIFEDIR